MAYTNIQSKVKVIGYKNFEAILALYIIQALQEIM